MERTLDRSIWWFMMDDLSLKWHGLLKAEIVVVGVVASHSFSASNCCHIRWRLFCWILLTDKKRENWAITDSMLNVNLIVECLQIKIYPLLACFFCRAIIWIRSRSIVRATIHFCYLFMVNWIGINCHQLALNLFFLFEHWINLQNYNA